MRRLLLALLVSCLCALPSRAGSAMFVVPDDFPDGNLEKLGPQKQPNAKFPYMYRLQRRSCASRCMIGKVFELVAPNLYRERSPADIKDPEQRARYDRLLQADLKAMAAWDKSDPTVDVTAQVRAREREIKDALKPFVAQTVAKGIIATRFLNEWDLKKMFPGDRCLSYDGVRLEKGDVANHAFGVAMAATGHSLKDTLVYAHYLAEQGRRELDQPQDQAAIMAGWVEERTKKAWTEGLYTPSDFIKMRCEDPNQVRSFWTDIPRRQRWDQLIKQYDRP